MNELVKAPVNAVVTSFDQVPEHLRDTNVIGLEALGQGDYKIPRILLLQSNNPECRNFPGKAIPGQFWHNTANVNLGSELKFVAAKVFKKAILFNPRHMGGGILAFSSDQINWDTGSNREFVVQPHKDSPETVVWKTKANVAQSGLSQFGTYNPRIENEKSPPALVGIFEYLLYLPDYPDLSPSLLSCSKTAIPAAKALNTAYMMRKKSPAAVVIKVKVKEEHKNGNDWYVPSFEPLGWSSKEVFTLAENLAKQFATVTLDKSDYESENVEAPASTGAAATGDEIPF